ncbi:MAG: gamma-glutamylcyclotransferase [Caldimonas sp.]|uniref:gamma-glutamylcyclotransferase family protein n=1 Tax=Caldimonas sp. TaxID=2838790 RepID=UPI003918A800
MDSPLATLHQPSGLDHVFVYGTLRRGGANDITRLDPPGHFVGAATVRGWLYSLGSYPGLLLDVQGPAVVGEVYALDPVLERVLDGIEELYPQQRDEYVKRRVAVEVAGRTLDCLVYEIHPRYVQGRRALNPPDWLHHAPALPQSLGGPIQGGRAP